MHGARGKRLAAETAAALAVTVSALAVDEEKVRGERVRESGVATGCVNRPDLRICSEPTCRDSLTSGDVLLHRNLSPTWRMWRESAVSVRLVQRQLRQ